MGSDAAWQSWKCLRGATGPRYPLRMTTHVPSPADDALSKKVRAPWWRLRVRRPRRRWLLLLVPDVVVVLLFLGGQFVFGWDSRRVGDVATDIAWVLGTGFGWLLTVGICFGIPVGLVLLGVQTVRRRRGVREMSR